MTSDAKAAEAFYRGVVGWEADVQPGITPGEPYTILKAGKVPVAGMIAMPNEFFASGNKPGWIGYIGVDNLHHYRRTRCRGSPATNGLQLQLRDFPELALLQPFTKDDERSNLSGCKGHA